ncbi:MAG: alpha-L-fucosidase, partial [Muribaculaceae bacterium]|nr:alpha-L-fucosidase [Muribaculaceae bacterium]
TCQTMNGMWGYKIMDQNYKDTPSLIRYLVNTAGMGANLLLNIGPQPNGELPAAALQRLKEMGEWMNHYGETIYATEGSDFPKQTWGTSTRKGDRLFVHIMTPESKHIFVPTTGRVKGAKEFGTNKKVKYSKATDGIMLELDEIPDDIDYIVELDAPVL